MSLVIGRPSFTCLAFAAVGFRAAVACFIFLAVPEIGSRGLLFRRKYSDVCRPCRRGHDQSSFAYGSAFDLIDLLLGSAAGALGFPCLASTR